LVEFWLLKISKTHLILGFLIFNIAFWLYIARGKIDRIRCSSPFTNNPIKPEKNPDFLESLFEILMSR